MFGQFSEMLRSEASANLIAWPMEGGSLSTSLHSSALKSFAAADVGSWDRLFKGKPEARNVVLRRADQAEKSLIELTSMPGYRDSLLLLRQLLATNDPTASHLPPALMRSLTEMGDAARLSLRPITAFRLTDGWSVALQSPDAPSVVWLASFADPAKGEVALPTSFNVVAIDSTQQEARP